MLAFRNLWRCQNQISIISQNPFRLLLRNYHNKEPVPVSWEKPEIGWAKLNFDGSSKGRAVKPEPSSDGSEPC